MSEDTASPERCGYVSLARSLEEARVGDALLGDRQPTRWRIDWFNLQPILVLLDPLRLTAPDASASCWVLFDDEDRPIFLHPLRSLMQPGDMLVLGPGGVVVDGSS